MVEKEDVWGVLSIIAIMFGSCIMVLPVLSIATGYVLIPFMVIAVGLLTYYTAWILVVHQNNNPTFRHMIK